MDRIKILVVRGIGYTEDMREKCAQSANLAEIERSR